MEGVSAVDEAKRVDEEVKDETTDLGARNNASETAVDETGKSVEVVSNRETSESETQQHKDVKDETQAKDVQKERANDEEEEEERLEDMDEATRAIKVVETATAMEQDRNLEDGRLVRAMKALPSDDERLKRIIESRNTTDVTHLKDVFGDVAYIEVLHTLGPNCASLAQLEGLGDPDVLDTFMKVLRLSLSHPWLNLGEVVLDKKDEREVARCFVSLRRKLAMKMFEKAMKSPTRMIELAPLASRFLEEALPVADLMRSEKGLENAEDIVEKTSIVHNYYGVCLLTAKVRSFWAAALYKIRKRKHAATVAVDVKRMQERCADDAFSRQIVQDTIDKVKSMNGPDFALLFEDGKNVQVGNIVASADGKLLSAAGLAKKQQQQQQQVLTVPGQHNPLATRLATVAAKQQEVTSVYDLFVTMARKLRAALGKLHSCPTYTENEYKAFKTLAAKVEKFETRTLEQLPSEANINMDSMNRTDKLTALYVFCSDLYVLPGATILVEMSNLIKVFLGADELEEAHIRCIVMDRIIKVKAMTLTEHFIWLRARVNALCGDYAEITELRVKKKREEADLKAKEKKEKKGKRTKKITSAQQARELEARRVAQAKAEAIERVRRERKVDNLEQLNVGWEEDGDGEGARRGESRRSNGAIEKDEYLAGANTNAVLDSRSGALVEVPAPAYVLNNARYKTFCRIMANNWKVSRSDICSMMEGFGCHTVVEAGKPLGRLAVSIPETVVDIVVERDDCIVMHLTEFRVDSEDRTLTKKIKGSASSLMSTGSTSGSSSGKEGGSSAVVTIGKNANTIKSKNISSNSNVNGKGSKNNSNNNDDASGVLADWDAKWTGHVPLYLRKVIVASLKKIGAVEGRVKKLVVVAAQQQEK